MIQKWIEILKNGECIPERDVKKLCMMVRNILNFQFEFEYLIGIEVVSILYLLLLYNVYRPKIF